MNFYGNTIWAVRILPVLLLNRYQSGSVGRLVTVASDGEEIASLDISEEVRDISANGRYLSVLYADRLVVYNRDLQIYATLHGPSAPVIF